MRKIKFKDKEEWLDIRNKGIGGSDVSAIMGYSKYKSAYEVYYNKTQNKNITLENEKIYWGNILEDIVAKEFSIRMNKKVKKSSFIIQHNLYDFIIGSVDRFIVGEKAILEIKTTGFFREKEFENEIPDDYYIQIQHYLMITGYDLAYIAILVGGQKLLIKEIKKDEKIQAEILEACVSFWNNNVLKNLAPKIELGQNVLALVNGLYASNDEQIYLPEDKIEPLNKFLKVKKDLSTLEQEKVFYESIIKDAMQGSNIGILGNMVITLNEQSRTTVDMDKLKKEYPQVFETVKKISTFKVMRIKGGE